MEGNIWFNILILFVNYLQGTSISILYPFGDSVNDTRVSERRDEDVGTSPYVSQGNTYTTIDVSYNGELRFPFPDLSIIKVFSVGTQGGQVFYRDASGSQDLLDDVQNRVRLIATQSTFVATSLFIATWEDVISVEAGTEVNTYQAALVSDGAVSFVILLYQTLNWYQAFGAATVGFGNITLPGSGTAEVLNLRTTSNIGTNGVWILRVDSEATCTSSECINGTCVDVNTCCTGDPICNTFCDPSCLNGNCIIRNGMTVCDCVPGFGGEFCEPLSTMCARNLCQNGGSCFQLMSGIFCSCPSLYTGSFCEIAVCDPSCVNGNCTKTNGTRVCDCFPGYTGEVCDRQLPCAINPCLNGGSCVEIMSMETCICPATYTGRFCDVQILESTCYKKIQNSV